ncbi:hypothetical protein CK203_077268 [Vitis vinifera]|uniref:Uncharacterized protein n=1 Tax=Vitis vinifera TaxID=29760 RepID=A0A438BUK8_VITVI|nr:hypothetical protein CK203_077268 [Vitis vinifera]
MKDQEMGSDQFLPISSPKLPIYSLPVKKEEPPGMLTPPLQAAVSVPFEWEEAPGKPRAWNRGEKARSARCLDLPPRMSARVKISDVCSPTTVLEGPYVGRSVSFGNGGGKSDGAKERSSVAAGGGGEKETKVKITRMTRKGSFLGMSSTRSHLWGFASFKIRERYDHQNHQFFSFRFLRNNVPALQSSVCESFKQVVPWRPKPEKMRKMKSIRSAIL